MSEVTKVIVADQNNLIRQGLACVLNSFDGIQVIGKAGNAQELRELVGLTMAEVVIIDYTSPEFSIDVIPESIQINPDIKFVAITNEQSAATIVNALRSGVSSHVTKSCCEQEIADSIIETAAGKKFFCGNILETIRTEAIDVESIDDTVFTCDPIALTQRELEIITYIAEGYTNNQIADKLFLSNHTVTTHRKNIMAKLGINNTAGIVMYAVKSNLVSPNKYLFASQA